MSTVLPPRTTCCFNYRIRTALLAFLAFIMTGGPCTLLVHTKNRLNWRHLGKGIINNRTLDTELVGTSGFLLILVI